MFAIVEIAGQQYKVQKDQTLFVAKMDKEVGADLTFDSVLLTADGSSIQVGKPTVSGITIGASVLGHFRGEKVLVFKKKRRKGYRKLNGHRQHYTQIKVNSIG